MITQAQRELLDDIVLKEVTQDGQHLYMLRHRNGSPLTDADRARLDGVNFGEYARSTTRGNQ